MFNNNAQLYGVIKELKQIANVLKEINDKLERE